MKGDETITTSHGRIELQDNCRTDESSKRLFDTMVQRVTQAYLWSTPTLSVTSWRHQQDEHEAPLQPICDRSFSLPDFGIA